MMQSKVFNCLISESDVDILGLLSFLFFPHALNNILRTTFELLYLGICASYTWW